MIYLLLLYTFTTFASNVFDMSDYRDKSGSQKVDSYEQLSTSAKVDFWFDWIRSDYIKGNYEEQEIHDRFLEIYKLLPKIAKSQTAYINLAAKWQDALYMRDKAWEPVELVTVDLMFSILEQLNNLKENSAFINKETNQKMLIDLLFVLQTRTMPTLDLVKSLKKHGLFLDKSEIQHIFIGMTELDSKDLLQILKNMEFLYKPNAKDSEARAVEVENRYMYKYDFIVQMILYDAAFSHGSKVERLYRSKDASLIEFILAAQKFMVDGKAELKNRIDISQVSVQDLNQIRHLYVKDYSLDLFIINAYIRKNAKTLNRHQLMEIATYLVQGKFDISDRIIVLDKARKKNLEQASLNRYQADLYELLISNMSLLPKHQRFSTHAQRSVLQRSIFQTQPGKTSNSCSLNFDF